MRGIYSDISHNGDTRSLEKLRLFFNLPDHACNTMKNHPESVVKEYMKMHMKEEITYDDIYKLIETDYKSTAYNSSGLETNVFEYLSFYIDTKNLNRPTRFRHESGRGKDYDFKPLVEESITKIFDTREGKIFLLAGIEKQD